MICAVTRIEGPAVLLPGRQFREQGRWYERWAMVQVCSEHIPRKNSIKFPADSRFRFVFTEHKLLGNIKNVAKIAYKDFGLK